MLLGAIQSLIYVSIAAVPLTSADMHDILTSSRKHNQASEITGLLIYKNGRFLQVLEGSPEAVNETMQRIRADTRHQNLQVLLTQRIPERHFGLWSMAFPKVDELTEEGLRPYSFIDPSHPQSQVGRNRVLRVLLNLTHSLKQAELGVSQ